MSDWQEERRRRDRARRDEVMSLPLLPVRRHGVIDGRDGDVLACVSVGPAGEALAVWTRPEGQEAVASATVSAAGAPFPDPGAARPVAARIIVHTPELAAVTPIANLALAHITVQPMPGGRSGSGTSMRAFTATTAGAGLIVKSRSARTGSSAMAP
jgi:hypothetical protein